MYEANDQLKGKSQTDAAKAGESGPEHNYDLNLILDIPLDISVELGKVKMPVNELLRLGQGSIIELQKSVGEALDIYVNNKLVAKGEVVILDDKFGVRVSDIINPIERVKTLSK
jgi:flagellar motor switch protein FliN/FliY